MNSWKKWIIICCVCVLGGVLMNRAQHIKHINTDGQTSVLYLTDGLLNEVPSGRWLNLKEDGFQQLSAFVYVDSFHPVLRTYSQPVPYVTEWKMLGESGEPLFLYVIETELNQKSLMTYSIVEPTIYEQIGQVEVGYNQPLEEQFVLYLNNGEKIIQILFNHQSLKTFEPVLEKAWEMMQEGE